MRHAPNTHARYPVEGYDEALPRAMAQAQARAFLIGMQRMLHDEDYGAPPLQAMRVIMVLPGAASMAPHAAHARPPRIALDTLHAQEAPPQGLRVLDGQVLRDAQGRLYERRGGETRALGRVVAGPQGRLFECTEAAEVEESEVLDLPADDDAHDNEAEAAAAAPEVAAAPTRRSAPRRARRTLRERLAPESKGAQDDRHSPLRALLPAPGKWVQVRYGDFAALLRSQLAQPERIAADYEIGAYLQVFDSARALDPEEASRWLFGDPRHAGDFAPWTTALAQRLGITLGSHAGSSDAAGEPGRIAAGQRFFALRLAADPTAGTPSTAVAATESAPIARRSVPPTLQCAIAPTRTREQAIDAMQHPARAPWWRRLTARVTASSRRAWQQQLAGRTLDEQLWSVAPPSRGLADPDIRTWAERTLRLAGYELPRMADEWEIFWRCRGAQDN